MSLAPPRMAFKRWWILWLFRAVHSVSGTCYDPFGHTHDHEGYAPCPDVPTMCCATGRSNPPGGDFSQGDTADECLPNGLCQNRRVKNGTHELTYWRNFCTDSNFSADVCLNKCIETVDQNPVGNWRMTPCDGTNSSVRWCCGENTDCCNGQDSISLLPKFVVSSNSSSASARPSSSTRPTSTSPTPATESVTSHSSTASLGASPTGAASTGKGGLTTGEKAGIGAGSVLGAALLLCAGYFVAKALQWRKDSRAAHDAQVSKTAGTGGYFQQGASPSYEMPVAPTYTQDLPTGVAKYEMPAMGPPQELSSSNT